jgi:hypothetical protein
MHACVLLSWHVGASLAGEAGNQHDHNQSVQRRSAVCFCDATHTLLCINVTLARRRPSDGHSPLMLIILLPYHHVPLYLDAPAFTCGPLAASSIPFSMIPIN